MKTKINVLFISKKFLSYKNECKNDYRLLGSKHAAIYDDDDDNSMFLHRAALSGSKLLPVNKNWKTLNYESYFYSP